MTRSGEERTERKSNAPCDKDTERSPQARRTLSTSKDDERDQVAIKKPNHKSDTARKIEQLHGTD